MSGWGKYDAASIYGTKISVTNGNTAVVGTGTQFTANLSIGDVLVIKSGTVTKNRVAAIADDTHLTLSDTFAGNTNANLFLTANVALQEQPLYAYQGGGSYGETGYQAIQTVYGTTTSQTANSKIAHVGWVKREVGTGGRAGRVQYETLVVSNSITTNTTDNATFPD